MSEFFGGGGGVGVGQGVILSSDLTQNTVTYNSQTFLRSGVLVNQSAYPSFPAALAPTSASYFSNVTTSFGTSNTPLSVATNESGTWVAVGTTGKVIRSTNDGITWNSVYVGGTTVTLRTVATDNAGVWVLAGDSGTMYRSTDNGESWSSVTSAFYSNAIYGVTTNGSGTWLGVGQGGYVTRSTDNGATWSSFSGSWGTALGNCITTDRAGVWIVAANSGSGQIFRSTDNGTNWTYITNFSTSNMATDRSGVWVATGQSGALRRSINNGLTWSSVSLGYTYNFGAIATDRSGVWIILASTSIRSTDNGATWSNASLGNQPNAIGASAAKTWISMPSSSDTSTRSYLYLGLTTAVANLFLRVA